MHELSIAMGILDAVEEQAARHGSPRVLAIHVRVGALAGVVPTALLSAFELAAEETEYRGAQLRIDEVPVLMYCPRCTASRPVQSIQWLCCVECGAPALEIVQGRELEISGLECEDAEAAHIGSSPEYSETQR